MGVGGRDFSMTAAGVASVAQAAVAASKSERSKPKMAYEVRPFTKESLEKINLRTSNLIRDYGFLPKRKPNLMDGAELPAKYEPFPPELIGKPVEEIDQVVKNITLLTYNGNGGEEECFMWTTIHWLQGHNISDVQHILCSNVEGRIVLLCVTCPIKLNSSL